MSIATPARASADIGLIGLAVMGQNLALNIADHGFQVAVYNRTTTVTEKFVAENPDTPGGLVGCRPRCQDFVAALKKPRKIIILVKAGPPVDAVIEQLLGAGRRAGRHRRRRRQRLWTDTIRREKQYAARAAASSAPASPAVRRARASARRSCPAAIRTRGSISSPIWEAIAAKVDAETGKPLEGDAPGKPVTGGVPCTAYIGPNGAGHYVKMVHNGIEYGDMQLICEAYHLLMPPCSG